MNKKSIVLFALIIFILVFFSDWSFFKEIDGIVTKKRIVGTRGEMSDYYGYISDGKDTITITLNQKLFDSIEIGDNIRKKRFSMNYKVIKKQLK